MAWPRSGWVRLGSTHILHPNHHHLLEPGGTPTMGIMPGGLWPLQAPLAMEHPTHSPGPRALQGLERRMGPDGVLGPAKPGHWHLSRLVWAAIGPCPGVAR